MNYGDYKGSKFAQNGIKYFDNQLHLFSNFKYVGMYVSIFLIIITCWLCMCMPAFLSLCLNVGVCISLPVSLNVFFLYSLFDCLCACLPVRISVCMPVCLINFLCIYLHFCLSVCLNVCLPAFLSA